MHLSALESLLRLISFATPGYLLSNIIFARIDELSRGAKPLVNKNPKIDKLSDIALLEIAEGKIGLERVEETQN